MTRYTGRAQVELSFELQLHLLLGEGADGVSEEELRAAWEWHGGEILRDGSEHGRRPWAHWRFDLREPQPADPDDETVRLAELGELHANEIASLRSRADAARTRIERGDYVLSDVGALVELHEKVERALERRELGR